MGSPLEVLANYNPTGFALANQQRQAQLAQTQAQTAAIAPQTQAVQLENQIRIRQLRDQDALTRAWTGIDSNADPATQEQQLERGIIQNGGSVNALLGARANIAEYRQKVAIAQKDELTNQQTIHEGDAGTIDSIVKGPEPDKLQSWHDFLPTLQSHHPGMQIPADYPGDAAATAIGNRSRLLSAISETNLKGAQSEEAQARTEGERQRNLLTQQQADRETYARQHPEDPAAQQAALTGKERTDLQLKQIEFGLQRDKLNNQLRHELVEEANSRVRNSIAAGRLEQTKYVNGIKYGPGSIDYWVQTLKDNPDAIKEIPADIKGTVNQAFRVATGLPLPTPLEGTLKQNETNAGTSIENINRIRQLAADPEIQARLGPILGRLGNVEQRVGTAAGLSPQAEEKAQELRTLMRYFVFQEGKTILGARLPRQLMGELQSSSANTHMDAPTLAGALSGAEAQANTVRDNAERARFGGQMRPQSMRSGPNQTANLPTVTTQEQFNALPKGALFIEDGRQYRKP